jgi:hypothetical protein
MEMYRQIGIEQAIRDAGLAPERTGLIVWTESLAGREIERRVRLFGGARLIHKSWTRTRGSLTSPRHTLGHGFRRTRRRSKEDSNCWSPVKSGWPVLTALIDLKALLLREDQGTSSQEGPAVRIPVPPAENQAKSMSERVARRFSPARCIVNRP